MFSFDISTILEIFILIPFIGFIASLMLPKKNEDALSAVSYLTVGLHWASINVFVIYWIVTGFPVVDHKYITLYQLNDYEFFIELYFDKITAVYLFVGSFLI